MWWILVACHANAPAIAPLPSTSSAVTGSAEPGGLALQGFDVTWETRPHRIRRVEFGAVGAGSDLALDGMLSLELRGGSWADGEKGSDTPEAHLDYSSIFAPDLTYLPGHADLALSGSIAGADRVTAAAGVDVVVPLDAGLPREALAVWITGFSFETDPAHPDGYTVHQLSVAASEPTYVDGAVHFRIDACFDAGAVPDRGQDLGAYGSTVRIDYAVIASHGRAQRFAIVSGDPEGREKEARLDVYRTPIALDVATGLPVAIAGLSSFDMDVIEDGRIDGRYLRSLTVDLEDERYDSARGRYEASALTRFANAGPLPRPVRVSEQASWTLIQLPKGEIRNGRFAPPPDGQLHRVGYPSFQAR